LKELKCYPDMINSINKKFYQTSISYYRYGFNDKENDAETGWQDYGMRQYNPKLGRFFSVDPITAEYPWYTPYQFAGNKPIQAIDIDGLEEYEVTSWMKNGYKYYKAVLTNPEGNLRFKMNRIGSDGTEIIEEKDFNIYQRRLQQKISVNSRIIDGQLYVHKSIRPLNGNYKWDETKEWKKADAYIAQLTIFKMKNVGVGYTDSKMSNISYNVFKRDLNEAESLVDKEEKVDIYFSNEKVKKFILNKLQNEG